MFLNGKIRCIRLLMWMAACKLNFVNSSYNELSLMFAVFQWQASIMGPVSTYFTFISRYDGLEK